MKIVAGILALALVVACNSVPVQVTAKPVVEHRLSPVTHSFISIDTATYWFLDSLATASYSEHKEKMACLDRYHTSRVSDTLLVDVDAVSEHPHYESDSISITLDQSYQIWKYHPCIHTHIMWSLERASDLDKVSSFERPVPFDILMSVYGPHQWYLHVYALKP